MAIDLEKALARLSPEARDRVESALKDALANEGALAEAGFDRGPFDRSGFDRSTAVEVEQEEFLAKGPAKGEGPRAKR